MRNCGNLPKHSRHELCSSWAHIASSMVHEKWVHTMGQAGQQTRAHARRLSELDGIWNWKHCSVHHAKLQRFLARCFVTFAKIIANKTAARFSENWSIQLFWTALNTIYSRQIVNWAWRLNYGNEFRFGLWKSSHKMNAISIALLNNCILVCIRPYKYGYGGRGHGGCHYLTHE